MPTPSPLTNRRSSLNNDANILHTVVFSLADIENTTMAKYRFALPVTAVEKAIVYPADRPTLTDGIGMMNLGDHTLTIVDLRHKFTTIAPERDSSKFLILFHTQLGEFCGLPIQDAPVLLDIDSATVRSIPIAYREVNQLSFTSHMAIVPQDDGLEPLQILLLGLNQPQAQLTGSPTNHFN